MSGKKGRSGGWNKAMVMDYTMLKRYSTAYLLRLMRAKEDSPIFDEKKQFKIALEVVCRDIGKPQLNFDQSEHKHFVNVYIPEQDGKSVGNLMAASQRSPDKIPSVPGV